MIVVTGGAGFIGSSLIWKLNQMGHDRIIIVDELLSSEKWRNINGLKFKDIFHKDEFYKLVLDDGVPFNIDALVHLGACSSTTETDADYLVQNNYRYSVELIKYCLPRGTRFVYASSAATYGDGRFGYDDDESKIENLRPLNMYGYSKQMLDLWVKQMDLTDKIVGLKYFNVYGPNEYHKDSMRSVVHKAFEQIINVNKVELFKSYNPNFKDGEQMRDFIYVKDAVDMTIHFLENRDAHGLYNIGTGKARTFKDLVAALFKGLNKPLFVEYIDMPESIKNNYQYFTEANIAKIRNAGYTKQIHSLEDGITDYVKNYILKEKYLAWNT